MCLTRSVSFSTVQSTSAPIAPQREESFESSLCRIALLVVNALAWTVALTTGKPIYIFAAVVLTLYTLLEWFDDNDNSPSSIEMAARYRQPGHVRAHTVVLDPIVSSSLSSSPATFSPSLSARSVTNYYTPPASHSAIERGALGSRDDGSRVQMSTFAPLMPAAMPATIHTPTDRGALGARDDGSRTQVSTFAPLMPAPMAVVGPATIHNPTDRGSLGVRSEPATPPLRTSPTLSAFAPPAFSLPPLSLGLPHSSQERPTLGARIDLPPAPIVPPAMSSNPASERATLGGRTRHRPATPALPRAPSGHDGSSLERGGLDGRAKAQPPSESSSMFSSIFGAVLSMASNPAQERGALGSRGAAQSSSAPSSSTSAPSTTSTAPRSADERGKLGARRG